MSSFVLQERQGSVLRLTLNRPDVLNAFNLAMARELQGALDRAASDPDIRAVLLTGAGRAFCAGQDLASVPFGAGDPAPDLGNFVRDQYNPIVARIRGLEKPVICAVNGVAAGAGANLAFACDIVLASSAASFIQSFAKIGLIPDSGGTWTLPRLVGYARAAGLMMLGDKLSAADALAWGMIWKVCEPDHLSAESSALAESLSTQPTRALGLIKRLLNASAANDLGDQLRLEEALQREAGNTADFREGVEAFLAKRKPVFRGE
jgi:2-(1,2-epoxy-1,2-dihydrophenyl)acetyl-CoA isomerase